MEQAEQEQTREHGPASTVRRVGAHAVHALTASGVVFAMLAAIELIRPDGPRLRAFFGWLTVQVLIDAIDGPLARLLNVRRYAPAVDGRKIDDIIDYLTYTFLPLLLVWRMGWVLPPAGLWVGLAMIASLFGFCNAAAKQEDEGFFLGFPSYWNIFAFYAGLLYVMHGPWAATVTIVVLTMLTVLPVRFVYPNLAPRPWRLPMIVGGVVWLLILLAMLRRYPQAPAWMVWVSLIYPASYVALSIVLDVRMRRQRRAAHDG